jgi:hypothetical protein
MYIHTYIHTYVHIYGTIVPERFQKLGHAKISSTLHAFQRPVFISHVRFYFVWGLGFWVWGLGSRVRNSGFRVRGYTLGGGGGT